LFTKINLLSVLYMSYISVLRMAGVEAPLPDEGAVTNALYDYFT